VLKKQQAKRIAEYSEIEENRVCYYKSSIGNWLLWHPKVGLGSLNNHTVTENDNGTITVKPSIKISLMKRNKKITVHGYLTDGIWRSV